MCDLLDSSEERKFAEILLDYKEMDKKIYKKYLDIAVQSCSRSTFTHDMSESEVDCFDTIVTVAEEAFAILVLENNYDKWSHIAAEKEGRPPQPRYMKKVDLRKSTKNCAGDWTDEGLTRFNEIVTMVLRKREDNCRGVFLSDIKKLYEEEMRNGLSKKRRNRNGDDDDEDRPQVKQRVVVMNLLKK